MSASKHPEYLIVGQGLAGSLLAWQLHQQGKTTLVVDNHHQQSSSMVAAGLLNPVSGKRLTTPANIDKYLMAAHATYSALENHFDEKFFHSKPMLRLIKDSQQADYLKQRLQQPGYQNLLGNCYTEQQTLLPFINTHGAVIQKQTGYLDIPKLLNKLRDWLYQQARLSTAEFAYNDLHLDAKQVTWLGQPFDKVIFCEGHQLSANPWFDWLPLQKAKGDILTIKSTNLDSSRIINRGNWLLPLDNQRFKIGASHYWQFSDDRPEAAQQNAVINAFTALFEELPAYTIEAHQAGIRPATRDKNPFIGAHPQHPQLLVFNGFGAHGSLMMPYYSQQLAAQLVSAQPLPEDVLIDRYWKH